MNPLIKLSAAFGALAVAGGALGYAPLSYRRNSNLSAFLAMLRKFESNDNYRAWVYGGEFSDMSDHPIATGEKQYMVRPDGRKTSAAGAYQIVYSTWVDRKGKAAYGDFTPTSQDQFAIDYITDLGALPYINEGLFSDAVSRLSSVWESLAVRSDDELMAFYLSRDGKLA